MKTKDITQPPNSDTSNNTVPVKQGALKLKEACRYLGGISPSSLRRLIDRQLLKPNRALRHILIPVSELDRFIKTGGAS
jgi:Helix-turn-helix domain